MLSEFMRPAVDLTVSRWMEGCFYTSLGTTEVTVMETAYGVARLPEGKRRSYIEDRFRELVQHGEGLTVLVLDVEAARFARHLRARRDGLDLPSSQADMMIAAMCLMHDATLATRNIKDFERLGLELINPFSG